MRHHPTLPLLLLLPLACPGPKILDPDTGDSSFSMPGCGDGVLDPGEQCDDGENNDDLTADACRRDCRTPVCGDHVVDSGEACDDGDPWGGDGCTPACTVESGELEDEPNDTWIAANRWEAGVVHGSLPAGDRDCFSLTATACGAISARLQGPCDAPVLLSLHDPSGAVLATGTPEADACARLDPAELPGARFLAPGTWTLCLEGMLGATVPSYALEIDFLLPDATSYPLPAGQDPDNDGLPDQCDEDRDGDGVANGYDNCPDIPNGPDAPPLAPSADGFIRTWLAAGPYTGTSTTEWCRPSTESLVADDDAYVLPRLGANAGSLVWTVLWSFSDRVDFLEPYGWVAPSREVYTAVYVRSELTRTLTLAIGPDDGARAWWNAEVVMDISGCQGTVVDRFQQDVTLRSGWNLLLLKVRDWGGEWGNYVRFLEGGAPVVDLELSLAPGASWASNQDDADGDGLGDVCDSTPWGGS